MDALLRDVLAPAAAAVQARRLKMASRALHLQSWRAWARCEALRPTLEQHFDYPYKQVRVKIARALSTV